MTDAQRAGIVDFWRTVERFSPPTVDKPSRQRRIYTVQDRDPLPWEPEHELARVRLRDNQTWRHVVYLGIYPLESVFDVLTRVFEPDAESVDQRPAGDSALAAFVVSADGRPLMDSAVVSSCAWSTGRVLLPGPGTPGWLDGFDLTQDLFTATFAKHIMPSSNDKYAQRLRRRGYNVGRSIGRRELQALCAAAADCLNIEAALPHSEIRISSQIVSRRSAYTADGHNFLNSFIVDDLANVADQTRSGTVGPALRQYLRPNEQLQTAQRADVRTDLDTMLDATSPQHVPLGRWPSSSEHPLALTQQLAVNNALRLADTEGGILAVNGPPGTGKTTMLRDIVSNVIVERARQLAELSHPRDAFTGTQHRWLTSDYTRVVHEWKPQLTGFEMVVASANNGAVENVTNEIPDSDAIDSEWHETAEQLDYFADIASALLTIDHDDETEPASNHEEPEDLAWGLITARLGNKHNRSRFVDTFWYRAPTDPRSASDNDDSTDQANQDQSQAHEAHGQQGLWAILKDYEQSSPPCSWHEAVADFHHALTTARTVQDNRTQVYNTLQRHDRAERDLSTARDAAHAADSALTQAQDAVAQCEHRRHTWHTERERRLQLRTEHHQFKPGFLEWLTTLGKALRQWRDRDQHLASEVAAADEALDALAGELSDLAYQVEIAQQHAAHHSDALDRAEQAHAELREQLDQAREHLGQHYPDNSWWQERSRRELSALWTDPEWNSARTHLFLAALRLHKAFVQHTPTEMRQTLHAATDILSDTAPRDIPEQAALAAWQAVFFVVPVVSTTFASFARLFSHLRQESLGWLLIDEAGQATPQSAVGALWRSRRAVIVGDPLQLEPISTLPFRAEQAIRRDHHVDEQWLTSRTSVQRLADRLATFGTHLPSDDGTIWVGCPLSVHRRCDQPMFSIANDIAYDGLMIHATAAHHAQAFDELYPPHRLPASKWIDINTDHAEGHWIPAEGHHLDRILATLHRLHIDMTQVMVIAPFRDVAQHLRQRTNDYPGLVAGTIHTAQGKQADIVILVLGSDPQRHGARRWAASKPNLLNVAASRAKRRLYVIGDRQAWAHQRHFDVLAAQLPHALPRQP